MGNGTFSLDDETSDTGGEGNSGNGPNTATGSDNGTGNILSGGAGGTIHPENAAPIAGTPKRRGRQPYPRDANGNIIRPDGTTGPAPKTTANKGGASGLGVGGYKPNDRGKVNEQIQGLHGAVAVLTNQPVFMLAPQESLALTNALCDVLDYHRINLFEAGGHYGLYVTLIITVFGIYKPRVDIIASGGKVVGMTATAPTSKEEAANTPKPGMMDFSADTTMQ